MCTTKLPVGIGTGPFAFTSIDAAGAKLKANRTSWQPPKVDAMETRVLPEGVARAQAVLSGGMDIAMAIDRGDVDDIRAAGGSAQVRFTARMPYFAFVTQDAKAPINDVRVRLAMNYAVDRDKIIKSMMPPGVKSSAQLAMTGAVRKFLAENPDKFDAREWLKPAREAAKAVCKQRYLEFGCEGQAAKIKGATLSIMAAKYAKGELAQVVH